MQRYDISSFPKIFKCQNRGFPEIFIAIISGFPEIFMSFAPVKKIFQGFGWIDSKGFLLKKVIGKHGKCLQYPKKTPNFATDCRLTSPATCWQAMGTYINKGNSEFRDIVSHEYVDKTSLIPFVNATLNSERRNTPAG